MAKDISAGAQPKGLDASVLEAAEIRAWRADKVRRLPRRARRWTLRLIFLCVAGLLLLGALSGVMTLATPHATTGGVLRLK